MCTAYGTCICGEVRRETLRDKSKLERPGMGVNILVM